MPRMGVLESGIHVGRWRVNYGDGSIICGTPYKITKSPDLSLSTPENGSASRKRLETHVGYIYYLRKTPKPDGKHNSKALIVSRNISGLGEDGRNSCHGRGDMAPNHLIPCGTSAIYYGHRQRYRAMSSS
jgi:hypothetical protein